MINYTYFYILSFLSVNMLYGMDDLVDAFEDVPGMTGVIKGIQKSAQSIVETWYDNQGEDGNKHTVKDSGVVTYWQPPVERGQVDFTRQEYATFKDILTIRNMMIGLVNETELSAREPTYSYIPNYLQQGLVLHKRRFFAILSLISPLGEFGLVQMDDYYEGEEYVIQDIVDKVKHELQAETFNTLPDDSFSIYGDAFEITRLNGKRIPEARTLPFDEFLKNFCDKEKQLLISNKIKNMRKFYLEQGGVIKEVEDIKSRRARLRIK